MAIDWTQITTPAQILDIPNVQTGGWFWFTTLVVITAIIFISLIKHNWVVAGLVSGFIGLITSILTTYMGLTSFKSVLMFISILILFILYIFWSSPAENT